MHDLTIETAKKASAWLAQNPLFLDTETTGLSDTAQIIEIAITDKYDTVLFNQRIRPNIDISAEASAVHGITAEDLVDMPTWSDISAELEKILSNRIIVIFDSYYDIRLLLQTAAAFNESTGWINSLELSSRCAMYLAADFYGANAYGMISLRNATAAAEVVWKGDAHSALADTLATVDLVKTIASYERQFRV